MTRDCGFRWTDFEETDHQCVKADGDHDEHLCPCGETFLDLGHHPTDQGSE